jgi:hypothetical protein
VRFSDLGITHARGSGIAGEALAAAGSYTMAEYEAEGPQLIPMTAAVPTQINGEAPKSSNSEQCSGPLGRCWPKGKTKMDQTPKAILRKARSARQARAAAEDVLDAAWLAEADRIWRRVATQDAGSDRSERLRAVMKTKLPPQPPGFHERIYRCNRCGQSTECRAEHDAHSCRRCERWTERKWKDAAGEFCRQHPATPLATT